MQPHDLSQNIVNALSLNLRVKRVLPSLAEVLRGSRSKQADLRVVRYEIPFNRDEKRRSGARSRRQPLANGHGSVSADPAVLSE